MGQNSNDKPWDLEERTERFAARCRALIKQLPRTMANAEDARQLLRCSGSVGANYIEANDALGKKDFLMKIRLTRREAKESRMFLRLLDVSDKWRLHQSVNHLCRKRSSWSRSSPRCCARAIDFASFGVSSNLEFVCILFL